MYIMVDPKLRWVHPVLIDSMEFREQSKQEVNEKMQVTIWNPKSYWL